MLLLLKFALSKMFLREAVAVQDRVGVLNGKVRGLGRSSERVELPQASDFHFLSQRIQG